jgi:hypothetical protein
MMATTAISRTTSSCSRERRAVLGGHFDLIAMGDEIPVALVELPVVDNSIECQSDIVENTSHQTF